MVPQTRPRKTRNSSKVNLLISFVVHALIIVVAFYFAARGGLLGKQLKKIAVQIVKEKPPEKPKVVEKPKPVPPPKEQPPKETPRPQPPKVVEAPKIAPPPASAVAPPAVAPPAAELPAFSFGGGKAVQTSADPVELYKGLLQSAFTARWDKPGDIDDARFVDEVQVSVDRDGRISHPEWLKSSGNHRWDDSVRKALAAVTSMDHPPPTNFPPRIIIRFDVAEETEPVLQ